MFLPGQTVIRRSVTAGRVTQAQTCQVVSCDDRGLLLSFRRTETNVLLLVRSGTAHAVEWHFAQSTFTGWQVRFESPPGYWARSGVAGLDSVDHRAGIAVAADHSWRWTGEPRGTEFAGVRAEGARVIARAVVGQFPFDGTWCEPPRSWLGRRLLPPAGDWLTMAS